MQKSELASGGGGRHVWREGLDQLFQGSEKQIVNKALRKKVPPKWAYFAICLPAGCPGWPELTEIQNP